MSSSIPLSRRLRVIFSLLILIHLAAVFAPPMAFQSRGPRGVSPSVSKLLAPFAAYGQFLYLDRGYAFFAPDPGPSHLLRAEIGRVGDSAEGERAGEIAAVPEAGETRSYPDLREQWPRLLYHRHFMLAEFLNDAYQPRLPADAARLVGPELPLAELKVWRLGRQRYDRVLGSMTHHLEKKFGGRAVTIDRVEHLLPDFVAYATDPLPLSDPSTYIVLGDFPINLEALLDVPTEALPPGSPSGIGPREPVLAPSAQGAPSTGDFPSREPDSARENASSTENAPSVEPFSAGLNGPITTGGASR